ncbi:MAG TPA: cupin domain-containing protein [Pyrinomonadaceae bacterium]|nr:cupin domain-containing protein [Pyrinomonadaceae bacterium]
MKQKIKRILLWKLLIITGYLIGGIIFHHYLFPPAKPEYASYFKPGDKFHSHWEAVEQTVLSQKDGWLVMNCVLGPKAAGPPVHIHENFDETFFVKQGVLSVLLNGEKKTVRAGEKIHIPKGTPHKPFNETDLPVVIENADGEGTFPVEFGYHLSQFYAVVDDLGENPSYFKLIMQLSVYGEEMDSWLADAPSIGVQKAMRFTLAPTARLLGYKNYYEEYRTERRR